MIFIHLNTQNVILILNFNEIIKKINRKLTKHIFLSQLENIQKK